MMKEPKPLKFRTDNDCPHCMTINKSMFNSLGDFHCEACDILYALDKPKPIGKCPACEGKGKVIKDKIRQVCCEKFLELGLCCQIYKLDLEEFPIKCEICKGTGIKPKKTEWKLDE